MSSRVALAAARGGAAVQVVGKTGDDETADGVVLDLARGGVGHVALLRDSARATPIEAALPDAVDEPESDEDPDPTMSWSSSHRRRIPTARSPTSSALSLPHSMKAPSPVPRSAARSRQTGGP